MILKNMPKKREAIHELTQAATSLASAAYSASRTGALAVSARLGEMSGACVRMASRLRVLLLAATPSQLGGLRARLRPSGGAGGAEEEGAVEEAAEGQAEEGPAEQEPPPTPLPA